MSKSKFLLCLSNIKQVSIPNKDIWIRKQKVKLNNLNSNMLLAITILFCHQNGLNGPFFHFLWGSSFLFYPYVKILYLYLLFSIKNIKFWDGPWPTWSILDLVTNSTSGPHAPRLLLYTFQLSIHISTKIHFYFRIKTYFFPFYILTFQNTLHQIIYFILHFIKISIFRDF